MKTSIQNKILILGGGFAGLGAANKLAGIAQNNDEVEITLIDQHPYTTMVPSLPDLAGNRIPGKFLTEKIEKMVNPDIRVATRTVTRVDMRNRTVATNKEVCNYDYLVLATGSVTNFFGFNQHLEKVHKLDFLSDGERIAKEFPEYLQRSEKPNAIVVGGGYTGLELACNLRCCAHKLQKSCDIAIVELKDTILPGMPDAIRHYMEQCCRQQNLEMRTETSVQTFDGTSVELSDGTKFHDVFVCWSTGTKFGLDMEGNYESIKDGRVIVDSCLRIPQHPEIYAAGDAAAINSGNGYLRKAVNFSLYSGRHAGTNITRAIRGEAPKPWTPRDLGWVIPFCNTATGKLFAKCTVRGRFPLALHYFMCGYRNYNRANQRYYYKMALAALRHRCRQM